MLSMVWLPGCVFASRPELCLEHELLNGRDDTCDGRIDLIDSPSLIIRGESGTLLQSIGDAGDVDGDGRDDLLLGAWSGAVHPWSTAYLVYSDPSWTDVTLGTPTIGGADVGRFYFDPEQAGIAEERGGRFLGTLGDSDGDGYSSFFIADDTRYPGQLHVYDGGPVRMTGNVDFTNRWRIALEGVAPRFRFGHDAWSPDDGARLVVLSTSTDDVESASFSGRVHVLGPLPQTAAQSLTPVASHEQFHLDGQPGDRYQHARLCDVDGQPPDDLLVWSAGPSVDADQGEVRLFLDASRTSSSADQVVRGPGSHFGASMAIGDFDGNGADGLAVGSTEGVWLVPDGLLLAGGLLDLELAPAPEPFHVIMQGKPDDLHVGDVNGDGRADLVIAQSAIAQVFLAPFDWGDAVVFGDTDAAAATVTWPGMSATDVRFVGDVDGNGSRDLAVGDRFAADANGEPNAGAVYVFLTGYGLD